MLNPTVFVLSENETQIRRLLKYLRAKTPYYYIHGRLQDLDPSRRPTPHMVLLDAEGMGQEVLLAFTEQWHRQQPTVPLILLTHLRHVGCALSLQLLIQGGWDLVVKTDPFQHRLVGGDREAPVDFLAPQFLLETEEKVRQYLSVEGLYERPLRPHQKPPSREESAEGPLVGESAVFLGDETLPHRSTPLRPPVAYVFLADAEGLGPTLRALKTLPSAPLPFFIKTTLPPPFLKEICGFLEKEIKRPCVVVPPTVKLSPQAAYLYGYDDSEEATAYRSGHTPYRLERDAFFDEMSRLYGGAVRCFIFGGADWSSLVSARDLAAKGADFIVPAYAISARSLPALLVKARLQTGFYDSRTGLRRYVLPRKAVESAQESPKL